MRIAGERAGFKDVRRFTKVLEGQQGKYTAYEGRKEGRKEGPTPRRGRGCAENDTDGVGGSWRFLFKQHQRACRKFSTVLAPYPAHLGSYETVFHLPAYACTRVPTRSSGVPGDSLGHRRMANVVSSNGRRRPPPLKG